MKFILRLALLFPLCAFAQKERPALDPQFAAQNKISVLQIHTLIGLPHDSSRLDTMVREKQFYHKNGKIEQNFYSVDDEKNHFETHWMYFYTKGGQRSLLLRYEGDKIVDSTIYRDEKHYTWYRTFNKKFLYTVYAGDSIREYRVSGKDTTIEPWRTEKISARTHWTKEYTGYFDNMVVKEGSNRKMDTCIFYEKGKKKMMLVDHYDAHGNVISTTYYNYRDNYYRIYSETYNDNFAMSYYMKTSKKGEFTYQVFRKYNEKDLITEEKIIGPTNQNPVVIKKYTYEYFP